MATLIIYIKPPLNCWRSFVSSSTSKQRECSSMQERTKKSQVKDHAYAQSERRQRGDGDKPHRQGLLTGNNATTHKSANLHTQNYTPAPDS